MAHVLYTYPNNPRAYKALVAAAYNDVSIQVPAFQMGTENKTEAFLQKNPQGKVPVLETPHGPIFESNAIARYVARSGKASIYGSNVYEAGLVDQWIDFSANEIELPALAWLLPIFGRVANNPKATARAKEDLKKALGVLNDHLLSRTFLVGNRVSLADIVVFSSLVTLYQKVFDLNFRRPFANVNRWFLTLVHQPEFKKVVGEVKLAEKMEVAPAAPAAVAEAAHPKQEKKQQEKKEKPAAAEKKPAAEKKKKPEEDEDDDDDGVPREEEPKGKNPLDLLPKSEFVMDEWKRTYSNTKDTRGVAVPWFWQKYDPTGYSIWSCEYKYNAELSAHYKVSNLVGGWFQRLDKLRKYGFGAVMIHQNKDTQAFHLSGVWLFRGSEVPAEMKDNDDAEHYNWKKLDTNDENVKKLVNDYWAWDGEFEGKGTPIEGKVFK